ncbi:MAG: hypothetical protein ACC608_05030 [Anaerofustis sp.]
MQAKKTIKVGIGFATGRKSFQKVLKTYAYTWREGGLTDIENISLNLLVAYDLNYANTEPSDYTNIRPDIRSFVDEIFFIGRTTLNRDIEQMIQAGIFDQEQAKILFGTGYAAKRNAVLYTALKNGMDYLLFLDDDEYPMAVTKTGAYAIWGGQHVLAAHLDAIGQADITNGYHCGYISPIPSFEFNDVLTPEMFRQFIEAISNDIVNWESIGELMKSGGVTYADTKILTANSPQEVPETNGTKFITGANLCLNLTKPERVFPFYNPPGARGEDTFLSTCLHERKVLRVPCYTFHDGFSTYNTLMDGVLPINLKKIDAKDEAVVTRFYRTCVGWIRYKPLLLYITQSESYQQQIDSIREKLMLTLPRVCTYFGNNGFMTILRELNRYDKNVKKHYRQFMEMQEIWNRITSYLQKDAKQ